MLPTTYNNNKYGSFNDNEAQPPEDKDGEVATDPIEYTQYIVTTPEERRRKCMNALTPVLLFLCMMGAIVYALSRDFDHLYPGHQREQPHSHKNPTHWTVKTNKGGDRGRVHASNTNSLDVEAAPIDKPAIDYSHADCSYHHKCLAALLTGICCPTLEGIDLDCCN